jgi:hypothetical protein
MASLSSPVQSVLELFQGPLASVRFADIDAGGLAKLAAEVEASTGEVREQENKLTELRQNLAQRQEALLALAQQALAYARVYAENDEELLDAVNRIALPRAAKPRKAPTSAKGPSARDATGEAAVGAPPEPDAAALAGRAEAEPAADPEEAIEAATAGEASSEAGSVAQPLPPPARGSRKGRGAASQRATT